MVAAPRGVRDVPAEEFIKAYADHLKTNDKVCRAEMPILQTRFIANHSVDLISLDKGWPVLEQQIFSTLLKQSESGADNFLCRVLAESLPFVVPKRFLISIVYFHHILFALCRRFSCLPGWTS